MQVKLFQDRFSAPRKPSQDFAPETSPGTAGLQRRNLRPRPVLPGPAGGPGDNSSTLVRVCGRADGAACLLREAGVSGRALQIGLSRMDTENFCTYHLSNSSFLS